MITRLFILLGVWLITVTTSAANDVLNISEKNGSFQLAANGKAARICVSAKEPLSVRKVAQLFAQEDATLENIAVFHTERGVEIEIKATGEVSVEQMTKVLQGGGFQVTNVLQRKTDGTCVRF